MQATGTFRETGFSKGVVLAVIAMACAALLGGAGGYAARSVDTSANTPSHVQPAVQASQGGPDSDLTRALPTSAPKSEPVAAQPDHGFLP
jgi:hypothetical protein